MTDPFQSIRGLPESHQTRESAADENERHTKTQLPRKCWQTITQ